jgi:hypothetical protein
MPEKGILSGYLDNTLYQGTASQAAEKVGKADPSRAKARS